MSALQWSLDEITDNVLAHSKSSFGGLLQVTTHNTAKRKVNVIVADAGIGIPSSLRDGGFKLNSDSHALEQAIKEGVTSKPKKNQGNGLFGSYQISLLSGGYFRIESNKGSLNASPKNTKTQSQNIPFRGTVVNFEIDCSDPELLAKALRFKDRPHQVAFDWLEADFDETAAGDVTFSITKHVVSLRSRDAGIAVKNQMRNLIAATKPSAQIVIDFDQIAVISSSFADEVFGMLFAELGALRFMGKFRLVNVHPIVQGLIDRAIEKRVAANTHSM